LPRYIVKAAARWENRSNRSRDSQTARRIPFFKMFDLLAFKDFARENFRNRMFPTAKKRAAFVNRRD